MPLFRAFSVTAELAITARTRRDPRRQRSSTWAFSLTLNVMPTLLFRAPQAVPKAPSAGAGGDLRPDVYLCHLTPDTTSFRDRQRDPLAAMHLDDNGMRASNFIRMLQRFRPLNLARNLRAPSPPASIIGVTVPTIPAGRNQYHSLSTPSPHNSLFGKRHRVRCGISHDHQVGALAQRRRPQFTT